MTDDIDLPHDLSEAELEQIKEKLVRGEKLHAVKMYRSFAGCTLMEAKECVELLASQSGIDLPDRGSGCANPIDRHDIRRRRQFNLLNTPSHGRR